MSVQSFPGATARLAHRRLRSAQARAAALWWHRRLGAMGPESTVAATARIYVPGMVRLGRDVHLNDFVHIWGGGGVTLGDHVLVASHVVITSQSHDVNALASGLLYRETDDLRPVTIGRNVWIGSGATILPGVEIGDDSVIAAGAVVTRSVPPRSLVMGVPGKVVRRL